MTDRSTPELTIHHDGERSCFECEVDGLRCAAEYRQSGHVMRMTHTAVPAALEGRGIAAALVQAAFEHARGHGLKIDPQCSYVRSYMQRHPETQALQA